MPIDTSIITGTQEHKHSVDSSDGGFLESTVTGMTNLTRGGIIQGSATNIQTNLPIGSGLQYLRANAAATALEYATLAAGGASCSDSLTISGQTQTLCKQRESPWFWAWMSAAPNPSRLTA